MSNNLFSIIIPTRQRHDTLKYSMESVINQTYQDFELIIMDNFSSSETVDVVKSFNDPRISYYRAPERLSMTDNWELGLSKATGQYIFVLGDDDGLMPDGLELAAQIIENNKQVSIISWLRYIYGWDSTIVPFLRNKLFLGCSQDTFLFESKKTLSDFYSNKISHEYLPMVYNSLVKRELIDKIFSVHKRYFHSHSPDIASGVVNAYFSDSYIFSLRAISLTGVSGHSNGAASLYQQYNSSAMKDFLNDAGKSSNQLYHPKFQVEDDKVEMPTVLEISVSDVGLWIKDLFFPDDNRFEVDFRSVLASSAININRNTHQYDKISKYLTLLALKHGVTDLYIPPKQNIDSLYSSSMMKSGFNYDSNKNLTSIIVDCKQAGIFNVSQAAMLARGILPSIDSINTKFERFAVGGTKKNIPQEFPRIILDGVFFQLYKTGIARVWKSLLEEWAENGFGRHVVVLDRAGTAPKIAGIWYRNIPEYDYSQTDSDRQMLQQVCDEERADLFISTYYTTPINTPSVFMAYDMIPEVRGADFDEPMWREKHNGIRHASAYISISKNTAQDLVKYFPAISSDAVTVAHCGINNNFSPASLTLVNLFKTKYGISKSYFILVGANTGYKNIDLFLRAFAQLPTRQSFEIVITRGESLLKYDFREYTSGSVVHMLQLSDEELRMAYAGAIALVYPSKYEGFGLPVLEALACGCPVITCPNSSIPEVAGEAAIYVKDDDVNGLANALCEVQKPEVRQTLIRAGLEQAKKFSWSKMAETVSSALINATLLHLNLRDINLIVFPDWSIDEEIIGLELAQVVKAIAIHPNSSNITLLIYTHNVDEDDANLLLSSVAMHLLMEEELEVPEEVEISLVSHLEEIQWQALLPRIKGRIVLEHENTEAIAVDSMPKMSILDLKSETLH